MQDIIKNIIFIFYPPRISGKNDFFKKIAQHLYKNHSDKFSFTLITIGEEAKEFSKTIKINWNNKFDLIDFIDRNDNLTQKDFIEFQKKFNIYNINEVFEHASLLTSKHFPLSKYTDLEKNIVLFKILYFFTIILKKNNDSIMIDEGLAGLFTPLYKLFPAFNSYIFNMTVSRTDNKFVITHKNYQKWEKLEKKYNSNKFEISELSEAKKIIANFRKSHYRPAWFTEENSEIKDKKDLSSYKFLPFYKKIKKKTKTLKKYLDYPENIFVPNVNKLFLDKLTPIKREIHNKFVDWDQPNLEEVFMIFPLHVQPEATINVLGTYYTSQINTVKQISLNLPSNVFLYVKEHPAAIGDRESIKFYNEFKKMKNVKLINPYFDSYKLLKKSKGIITISSTMGFESIIFKKPVILLGDAFYKPYKFSFYVDNIKNLHDVISKIINVKFNIREKDIERFIASYIYELYDGNIYFYKDNKAYSKENINLICDAIISEINYIEEDGHIE